MNILIACEYSGRVRDAFAKMGHNAVSCDLLPSETPGKHYQGDVRDLLGDGWDMVIAHPPCTRLCNSGVRWLNERNLWLEMRAAAEFFRLFLNFKCPKIAIENPIPHRYAIEIIGRKYDQVIQPWMFGEPYSKATCLWLKGLPLLQPTNIIQEREQYCWKLPPGPERWKERSRTYQGIANAMAAQWGVQ